MNVDALAQEIRRVDGNHDLGAGQLAEALMPFLSRALGTQPVPVAALEFQRIRDALANGLTDEAFETADRALHSALDAASLAPATQAVPGDMVEHIKAKWALMRKVGDPNEHALAEAAVALAGQVSLPASGVEEALRERIAALEAALKPFAESAQVYDPPEDDDRDIAWAHDFTIGALRRARAASLSSGRTE